MSTSLSCLLGVAVCLSNSAVIFLLLRLLQGSTLAGVFVSSYITRESPPPLTNGSISNPGVMLRRGSVTSRVVSAHRGNDTPKRVSHKC